ncbi:MAG: hypothetical protein HY275_17485, partial [Gemmatimonadetes bacterium]|nr:hypothetical protein [Gemmatimonadota bacterium]
MRALEAPGAPATPEARGYQQLRALVLHGYFTSDVVMKDVLHTVVMPGRFDGAAPVSKGGVASDG